jgi:hypothetical protein
MANVISQALHYAHRLSRAPEENPRHVFVPTEIKALLGEFNTQRLMAQWIFTFTQKMNQLQKQWVEERVERAIKRTMRQQTTTTQPIESITLSPAEALYKIQEMWRSIDQLITPVLTDQRAFLEVIRVVLETTTWDTNGHNMDALEKMQDTMREQLLHKSLKVVVSYRKLIRTVEKLRRTVAVKKGKVGKEELPMTELHRPVDIFSVTNCT